MAVYGVSTYGVGTYGTDPDDEGEQVNATSSSGVRARRTSTSSVHDGEGG